MSRTLGTIAGIIAVAIAGPVVGFLFFGGGGEEEDWANQFIEITNKNSQERLPVDMALNDFFLCGTDAECSTANSAVQQTLIPYTQVVDEVLAELSLIEAPTDRARELQGSTEALLRNERMWAETVLECLRTLNEATCLEADAIGLDSVRMNAAVLDALEPFLED